LWSDSVDNRITRWLWLHSMKPSQQKYTATPIMCVSESKSVKCEFWKSKYWG
jgi:hypothetical protein